MKLDLIPGSGNGSQPSLVAAKPCPSGKLPSEMREKAGPHCVTLRTEIDTKRFGCFVWRR